MHQFFSADRVGFVQQDRVGFLKLLAINIADFFRERIFRCTALIQRTPQPFRINEHGERSRADAIAMERIDRLDHCGREIGAASDRLTNQNIRFEFIEQID